MLIVSQNEDVIINFDNVECINIVADLDEIGKVTYKLYYETSTKREELGTYATEERAKEVLVEIIQYFYNTEILKCKSDFFYIDDLNRLQENAFVYEMPKE